jgi:CheY-like chemotaxis protein
MVYGSGANVFREDIERCLASGMDGHVGKPRDFDELSAKLRKYCLGALA